MRYLLLAAIVLSSCANPEPPNPIAPIAKVNFKPLSDRIDKVRAGNVAIGTKLEETRTALDASIVESHQKTIDIAKLDATLTAASKSLGEAMAERKAQADEITFLNLDKNAAQELADTAVLAGNSAVSRANIAEGKNYQYELQKKEDEGNWGLNGVWRWTKYMGWHVLILVVILAGLAIALNFLAPGVIPVFKLVGSAAKRALLFLWHLIRPKPPS